MSLTDKGLALPVMPRACSEREQMPDSDDVTPHTERSPAGALLSGPWGSVSERLSLAGVAASGAWEPASALDLVREARGWRDN